MSMSSSLPTCTGCAVCLFPSVSRSPKVSTRRVRLAAMAKEDRRCARPDRGCTLPHQARNELDALATRHEFAVAACENDGGDLPLQRHRSDVETFAHVHALLRDVPFTGFAPGVSQPFRTGRPVVGQGKSAGTRVAGVAVPGGEFIQGLSAVASSASENCARPTPGPPFRAEEHVSVPAELQLPVWRTNRCGDRRGHVTNVRTRSLRRVRCVICFLVVETVFDDD